MRTLPVLAILLLLAGSVSTACADRSREIPEAEQGIIDLGRYDFQRSGPLKLAGEWEFYWKQLFRPADFRTHPKPDGDWIAVPSAWNGREQSGELIGGDGFATFRLRVRLPENAPNLALRIPEQGTSHRVWANGRLIASNGTVGQSAEETRSRFLPLMATLSGPGREIEIVVQIANFIDQSGGFWYPLVLGHEIQIREARDESRLLEGILWGALFIMGLYHLALFGLRRAESTALFFGLTCLLVAARMLVSGERLLLQQFPDLPTELALKIEYLSYYAAVPLFLLFVNALFPEQNRPRILKSFLAVCGIFSAVVVLAPASIFTRTVQIYQVVTVLSGVSIIATGVIAARRGREGAISFLVGSGFLFGSIFNDILHNLEFIHTGYVTPYGLFFFTFAQSAMLAGRFSRAFHRVEELSVELEAKNTETEKLNQELDRKVQERTGQLSVARDRIEKALTEIEKLNEFMLKMNATTDLNSILDEVFEYLNEVYNLEGVIVLFRDEEKNELYSYKTTAPAGASADMIRFAREMRVPLNENSGVIYQAYRRARPVYLPALPPNPRGLDRTIMTRLNLKRFLLAPLIVHDHMIAMIMFTSYEKETKLARRDIASISRFCEQIAGAVNSSFLLEEVERKRLESERARGEIQRLNEFTRRINETGELHKVIDQIMSYVEDIYGIDGITIHRVDRAENMLVPIECSYPETIPSTVTEFALSHKIPLDESGGFVYRTYRRQRPFYLSDTKRKPPHEIDRLMIENARLTSLLVVPLIVQNEVIAMVNLTGYKKRMQLNRDDIESISRFCEQIAGAVYSTSLLKEVRREREKSDGLLLNILPAPVANELKASGEVKPLLIDSVTVLFTDFVGFTEIASHVSPAELVRELDACFTQFDEIAERNNLEKLKTIGDAYMCAGGLPDANRSHPVDACLAALEFQAFMRQLQEIKSELNESYWSLRIGMHTGSVTAGVVGKNKFAYDIWGDTVNTASRMESGGESDRINISEATYQLVSDFFECEPRGLIEAKGKGKLNMYFLNSIRPELADPDQPLRPNERFRDLYAGLRPEALSR